ncbi:MAG: amidohydrolase family protein [Porticoccaceae bacterium]
MDRIIRNGRIVDGSGGASFSGDIAIRGGKIAQVGKVDGRGAEEIDAAGAVVAPGFIDVHTHFDAQVFWDQTLSPSIYHGVTTALAGNCGFTLAPLSGRQEDTDYLLRMLSRVEGMPLVTLQEAVKPDWRSFAEYLDKIDGTLAINTAFMVGHSALRRAVMGERALTDKASAKDIESMTALLELSLRQGGTGFSTTVSPTHSDYEGRPVPSRVAEREELLALAAVLRGHPGTWLELVFGVSEMKEEHYALASDMSLSAQRPINWNAVQINSSKPELLEMKLKAGDYAHQRGATTIALVPAAPMIVLLNFVNMFVLDTIPNWSQLVPMSMPDRVRALADPDFRAQLIQGAESPEAKQGGRLPNWDRVMLEGLSLPDNLQWNGKPLGAVAASRQRSSLETLFDLAVEEDLGVSFSMPAESVDEKSWQLRGELWRDRRCLIGGSDAGAHLDMLNSFAFSTQLLGEGVRRRGLLSLEEAVHRITALPAKCFGLRGRGSIAPGMAADLVIFDPETVDCGPIAMRNDLPGGEKRLYADAMGVAQVIVAGEVVANDNRATGRYPGRVLRSGRDTETVPIGTWLHG